VLWKCVGVVLDSGCAGGVQKCFAAAVLCRGALELCLSCAGAVCFDASIWVRKAMHISNMMWNGFGGDPFQCVDSLIMIMVGMRLYCAM
jgi:hypothetical protein